MTKDELLRLMRMYVSISQEYVQEYIDCIKREGQLELLRELINLNEGEE